MDWPAVEHVPVDDVGGVVELDEELAIVEGAELGGAAATAEEAGAKRAAGIEELVTEGAADEATEGGVAADPEAPEAPIEGAADAALYTPEDAGPDEPDPDPDEGMDDEFPDEEDPVAGALEFDPDDPPPAATLQLGPVGAVSVPDPSFSTEAPGYGNSTSAESTVSQSLVGMFALNMPGKDDVVRLESSGMPRVSLRVAALLFDPPLTLMDAQFMYISRLPILLNQVQANV